MEQIYHYTKLDVLQKIVNKEGLIFQASRYTNFKNGNKDCVWASENILPIIRNITKQKDIDDRLDMRPFIICFCKNGDSIDMWNQYAEQNSGGQLILNRDIIFHFATDRNENPDVFMDCSYSSNKPAELEEKLCDLYKKLRNRCIDDKAGDLLICQCFIKQECFQKEEECRYLIPCYDTMHFSLKEDGKVDIKEEQIYGEKGDKEKNYKQICIPKEALVGVVFGNKVSDENIKLNIQYIEECGYKVIKKEFMTFCWNKTNKKCKIK